MSERISLNIAGVQFDIYPDIFEDIRLMTALGDVQDETLSDPDRQRAMSRCFSILFGKERDSILDGFAEENGGVLTMERMGEIINEVSELVPKLKN